MRYCLLIFAAVCAAAADHDWSGVPDLPRGTELRIYKRGAKTPIMAQMDEANAERVVVIIKNTQRAIRKEEIDRIDWRPAATSPRVEKETKVTQNVPGSRHEPPLTRSGGQTVSTSTGFRFGTRPDFETIYRRKPEAASPDSGEGAPASRKPDQAAAGKGS